MIADCVYRGDKYQLIIPYTAMGLPLAIYLLKVYLDVLPEELFDAARIDGAGDLKTIPTGLLAFSSRYVTDYSLLFSALTIITLPMILIYLVFNRQIVEGIIAGSVK